MYLLYRAWDTHLSRGRGLVDGVPPATNTYVTLSQSGGLSQDRGVWMGHILNLSLDRSSYPLEVLNLPPGSSYQDVLFLCETLPGGALCIPLGPSTLWGILLSAPSHLSLFSC